MANAAAAWDMLQPWMVAADLAPGDAKCVAMDWRGFNLHRIRSTADPAFDSAFAALWREFGESHEMEPADIIARRLRWRPDVLTNGCALLYELLQITHAGEFVGVRDHTAIVRPEFDMAVVHLSHNLVAPAWRRSGIAGWLRALPAQAARTCLAAQRVADDWVICLIAEMEPADPANLARTVRLTAYEKAGYRKIDPAVVPYLQPDFRPARDIDASGGPRPLPLSLLVRIVGQESCSALAGSQVRGLVESLYRMYGAEFRPEDMEPVYQNLASFPDNDSSVRLLSPTATVDLEQSA